MSTVNKQQSLKGDPGKGKKDETSEPITLPEEVPESNDEKIDEDFPGYPHYPAKDDILNPDNHTERVEVDPENFAPIVKRVNYLPDQSGDELDVPGTELDDANELIGEEDEENNYYSLGGDNHEDLEENRNTFR